jgi:hypothetical protein
MSKGTMFIPRVIVLFPLAFVAIASAQGQATQKDFTSPDAVFRFKYSPRLIDCTKLVPMPGVLPSLSVPDGCSSQGPMCTSGEPEAKTLACYGYPKGEFKSKPEFIAATFFVAEIQETTEKNCLQRSQWWDPRKDPESGTVTSINGTAFKIFEFYDGWAGGGQGGRAYRAFHHGKCYELGIQTAFENSGDYDPGTIEEFTKQDSDKVDRFLDEPLHTFTFLK